VKITKVIDSSDSCWTDHGLVKALLSFLIQPTYRRVKQTPRPQFNVRLLQQPAVRQNLETKITKKLKGIPEDPNFDTNLTCLKSCITQICKAVLGNSKRLHQDWFDEHHVIEQLLAQKRVKFFSMAR